MYNTIFAIAKDSQKSCQWNNLSGSVTFDTNRRLSDIETWAGAYGITGKFIYYLNDWENRGSQVAYSIINNTQWVSGVLPDNRVDCICLVREDLDKLYLSFDGKTFNENKRWS